MTGADLTGCELCGGTGCPECDGYGDWPVHDTRPAAP